MLEMLITLTAGAIGFILARSFVRRRLRFVDAIQSPFAPFIAGAVAALIALPGLALLGIVVPLVNSFTAIAFGIGTGLGTARGARALRSHDSARRRLAP